MKKKDTRVKIYLQSGPLCSILACPVSGLFETKCWSGFILSREFPLIHRHYEPAFALSILFDVLAMSYQLEVNSDFARSDGCGSST